MNVLIVLGLASFVFVALFTWRAYKRAPGAGQSPRSAIAEAWVNIAIGFTINFVANLLILPLVGAHPTFAQNFWIGWIYTAVSVVRLYAIRRCFNAHLVALTKRIEGEGTHE